jgi:hypothetical protein
VVSEALPGTAPLIIALAKMQHEWIETVSIGCPKIVTGHTKKMFTDD